MRAVVPKMDAGGSIINLTSIEAHRADRLRRLLGDEGGVASLSKSLALEWRSGIGQLRRPDVIATPGIGPGDWPGTPDDVAGAAVFLASDLSRFVTGTTIHVDGGNWAAGGWHPVGGSAVQGSAQTRQNH